MPEYKRIDNWYDLPLYYDIVFDEDTDTEADFLDLMYQRHVTTGRKQLLEPACGSARLLIAMTKRGYQCTGFDLNPIILQYARSKCDQADAPVQLFHADMSRFQIEQPVDMAFCLVSTFKYLLTDDQVNAHFKSMANAIRPGGIYALGFHVTDENQTEPMHEQWIGRQNGIHVRCDIDSLPPDLTQRTEAVTVKMTITEKRKTKHLQTDWQFRTWTDRQLINLIDNLETFQLIDVHDFSYDPEITHDLLDDQLDRLLILKRR